MHSVINFLCRFCVVATLVPFCNAQTISANAGGASINSVATVVSGGLEGVFFSFQLGRTNTWYVSFNASDYSFFDTWDESMQSSLQQGAQAEWRLGGSGEATGIYPNVATWFDDEKEVQVKLVASTPVPRSVTLQMLRLKSTSVADVITAALIETNFDEYGYYIDIEPNPTKTTYAGQCQEFTIAAGSTESALITLAASNITRKPTTLVQTALSELNLSPDQFSIWGHLQESNKDEILPAWLLVDQSRDGVIELADVLGNSAKTPYRFWSNDDDDGVDPVGSDTAPAVRKDSQDSYISNNRDLEDFARLHLYIGGLQDALTGANPTLKVGLKWKNVTSGAPSIRVFRTPAAQAGSDDYLKSEAAGTALRATANAQTTALLVSGTSSVMLPVSFLDTLTTTQPKAWFVFEGVTGGKGQLVITINKADGSEIGEGPGVWLDIANVKSMYERAVVTPSQIDDPYDHTNVVPPPAMSWARDDNGFSFIPAKDEAKTYIIFVHGWNVSYESHIHKFAETTFKRLWQRGYKGRFVAFRWPTYSGGIVPDHYNQSEYRAWKSGESLKQLINQLPSGYTRNLVAHSMGNIVAGSALQKGASVVNYALLNAAVPAMCYDESTGLRQSWNYVTPNDDSDSVTKKLAYTGQLKNVAGNLVNFYLTNDEATSTLWELNNYQFKPQNQIVFSGVRGYYYGPNAAPGKKLWVDFSISPLRILTDKDESMAFAFQSVTKTAGADGRVAGAINDSVDMDDYGFQAQHSAQWERTFQQTAPFFDELLNKLGLPTLP